jgi:hypothetical protein
VQRLAAQASVRCADNPDVAFHARKLMAAARRRLSSESGGVLIEVIVSAAVLLTASAGIVLALQTADAQTGQQRYRAVAANLAATEIERLRSLKFDGLVDLKTTPHQQTESVDGVGYTVRSTTDWAMAADTRASGCLQASRSPQALKLTTTVSWPNMGTRAPVTISSLMAAPAGASKSHGALIVQVVDHDGLGVPDLSVALVGPSTATGVTDVNGCVKFSDLVPGMGYRIQFSKPGWATPDGQNAVDATVDVVAGQTQTKSFQYDNGAKATVNFVVQTPGGKVPTRVRGVTWSHPSAITPAQETQSLPGTTEASTFISRALPTNAAPYGVYADICTQTNPGASAVAQQTVSVPGTVEVRLPALNLQVLLKSGFAAATPYANADVFVTTPCPTRYTRKTGADGYLTDRGLPWAATLQVCVQGIFNGSTYRVSFSVPNNDYAGTARTLTVNTAGSAVLMPGNTSLSPVAGTCP